MTASGDRVDREAVVACRCEEVLSDEVAAVIAGGAASVNDVKRWTRAGMGACQGIFCVPSIAVMVAQAAGTAIETVAPMTSRAPVRPIRVEALADLAEVELNQHSVVTREDCR